MKAWRKKSVRVGIQMVAREDIYDEAIGANPPLVAKKGDVGRVVGVYYEDCIPTVTFLSTGRTYDCISSQVKRK